MCGINVIIIIIIVDRKRDKSINFRYFYIKRNRRDPKQY